MEPSPVASDRATASPAAVWQDDGAGAEVGVVRPASTNETAVESAVAAVAAAGPTPTAHAPRTARGTRGPKSKRDKRSGASPAVAAASTSIASAAESGAGAAPTTTDRRFVPPVGLLDGLPRRAPLTAAVVVLAVVATVAMSVLLRVPAG